jgi:DNA-binding IclR family transcriptional regulator
MFDASIALTDTAEHSPVPDFRQAYRLTKQTTRDYTISSVRNALRLLCAFSPSEPELGVSELARRLDIGKSSVHRLLGTLKEEGFVEQSPTNGRYALGLRLLDLGAKAAARLNLHEPALPYIEALYSRTGETVVIAVLDGMEVVDVERRESPRSSRLSGRIGCRNSAHCTSTGKLLLAFLKPAELERRLTGYTLEAKTPSTITDHVVLREKLERIRERGYATNLNESEIGIASIAAPIRDATGEVVAAISVAGALPRFEGPVAKDFITATVEAGRGISQRLGYRPIRVRPRQADA